MDQDTMLEAGFSRTTNVAYDLRVGDTFDSFLETHVAFVALLAATVQLIWRDLSVLDDDIVAMHLHSSQHHMTLELTLPPYHPVLITDQIPGDIKERQRLTREKMLDYLVKRWPRTATLQDDGTHVGDGKS